MKHALQRNAATSRLGKLRSVITSARCCGLVVVLIGGMLLGVAFGLLPSTSGHGTHVQLGMQSCSFLARTGYPCFGCGMTTSISAMTRGQIGLAFRAQPFGAMLCIGVFLAVIIGAIQIIIGKNLFRAIHPRIWWIWIVAGTWLLGWAYKVAAGIAAGQYPIGR